MDRTRDVAHLVIDALFADLTHGPEIVLRLQRIERKLDIIMERETRIMGLTIEETAAFDTLWGDIDAKLSGIVALSAEVADLTGRLAAAQAANASDTTAIADLTAQLAARQAAFADNVGSVTAAITAIDDHVKGAGAAAPTPAPASPADPAVTPV